MSDKVIIIIGNRMKQVSPKQWNLLLSMAGQMADDAHDFYKDEGYSVKTINAAMDILDMRANQ